MPRCRRRVVEFSLIKELPTCILGLLFLFFLLDFWRIFLLSPTFFSGCLLMMFFVCLNDSEDLLKMLWITMNR